MIEGRKGKKGRSLKGAAPQALRLAWAEGPPDDAILLNPNNTARTATGLGSAAAADFGYVTATRR